MKKAYNKDIWRAIWKGKKRFFSIMIITTLGVAMFTGLKAACVDLRHSADEFLDQQNLYDICVVSTLGLTEEDVEALSEVEDVAYAEGAYSETVHTKVGDKNQSVSLKTISASGLNQPYVVDGELPKNPDEIAVTEKFLADTGSAIGDKIVIEEDLGDEEEEAEEEEQSGEESEEDSDDELDDIEVEMDEEEEPNFLYTEYTITAVVIDPLDINNPQGAVSFRVSATDDYTFFVLPEAVESDVYTAVYLTLSGGKEMFCYSSEYEDYVAKVVDEIEGQIKDAREQARYDAVTGEAYEKLADAEKEADEKFAEAEAELADAEQEIADGWEELSDGEKELADAQKEAEEGLAEARQEIADGYKALADGKAQIEAASAEVSEGEAQLAQAKQQLTTKEQDTYKQIKAGRTQLQNAKSQTESSKTQLEGQVGTVTESFGELWPTEEWNAYVNAAKNAYVPVVEAQMADENATGTDASATVQKKVATEQQAFLTKLSQAVTMMKLGLDQQAAMLDSSAADYEAQLAAIEAQKAQLDALVQQMPQLALGLGQVYATEQVITNNLATLEEQEKTAQEQFALAWKQIEESEAQLIYGRTQVENGRAELVANEAKLADGETELAEKEQEIEKELADARAELLDGRQELLDGEEELADGKKEYEDKKSEVEEKLADAKYEIDDIDRTKWYVQDRTSLSGYANIASDADSIESLGKVFPAVFLIVAILISLTTITRMVEEDRGLIGTYKALGFTDGEIRRKYLLYASLASLFGGILGDICGYIVLPSIIFIIFDTMYVLPVYLIQFDVVYGIGGILLFMVAIVGATALACKAELIHMPAVLMRPKAPRSGSRVFLEYITPVWNRLSFLNKVTARNLFRYKKRLFMTIAGIMGCMALLLFGFAVKDSVTDLMPRQYDQVYRYDIMAVASAEDNDDLLSYMAEDEDVAEYLNTQIASVKLIHGGSEEKVQMIIVPEGADISSYVYLEDAETDEHVTPVDGGVYVTKNAANVLGFTVGDTIAIQDMDLKQEDAKVSGIVKNYLGNNVYMTQKTYESLFETYEPNGVLVNLSESCTDQIAYADALGEKDGVLSSLSTESFKEDFSIAFALINMVVYIVIIMAASLAFVVLFTLATTNISERNRELATIKVLGFYDREVHLYVNKETLILTSIGILCGIPLGYAFAQTLTYILNMPSMYLAVSLHTKSYLIAAGLSFGFALIVDFITDRSLDGIDPVEALKSIE